MSGRVCYLARTERGERPALVRLVGAASDQAWEGFSADDPAGVRREIDEAAAWVAERASRGDGPRGEIELLVVDAEGGVCEWVTSPSPDAGVVAAALVREDEPWGDAAARGEATVQALAEAPARRGLRRGRGAGAVEAGRKLAVLTVPDVTARLLVDALDERGVAVARVASLWQGLAQAWDPAAQKIDKTSFAHSPDGAVVVASSAPLSAAVLIDPGGPAGQARLVWSWSRAGELLAGGSVRLAATRAEGGGAGVRVASPEVARLTADWLAWSVQLGVAPARVLCIGPEPVEAESLAPSALGAALTKAWPGAPVDLVVHEDPVGATLARLAGSEGPGAEAAEARSSLVGLTRRPGRAHRSMYRWTGAAILAGAAALTGVGWRAWGAGAVARRAARGAEEQVQEAVRKAAPARTAVEEAQFDASPRTYLQQKINDKRLTLNPTGGLDPAKPILSELETISYVLGTPGVEVDEIQLLPSNALMYVLVPDTQTYENLLAGLTGIAGSHVTWKGQFSSTVNGKQRYTLEGAWKGPQRPAGAGGGG